MKSHITDLSFYQQWLNEKRFLSEGSISTYSEVINRFLKTNPDVDNLDDYNNFIIKYSIKKRCYHYYSALKSFIEFKITEANTRSKLIEGLIKAPIRNDIVMERKYLTEEQILDVINSLQNPKHRVIALIQTLTGVRAGDILKLKRDNIIPEEYKGKPTLRINITGKGKKRNVIYIHDSVAQEIIMQYITTNYGYDPYYFLELGTMKGRQGNTENEFKLYRMNYQWYFIDLKTALQSNHIERKDFASHDFRRCFARRTWQRWKDITILQSVLNHANPATSMRYLQQSGLKNIDHHYAMQMENNKTE